MQLIINNLTAKEIELANFMLARANEFFESEALRIEWNITEKDLEKSKSFRENLLKSFLAKGK